MRSKIRPLLGLTLTLVALALIPSSTSHAQTTEPLIYRRIFAPSDALDTQIRDLLPLKRDEFARRLAAIQQQTSSLAAQTLVRIEQATFRARLDGNHLAGQATFSVVAAGTDAALLPLQPCSFTIESAAWNTGDSRTAIFGADQNDKLLCLVDHSGDLALKWRQAATEASSNQQSFALQFPPAPYRRLEINAPASVELTIDSGLILANQPSTEEPDRRTWIIELTGSSSARLNAYSDRQQRISAPRIFARDTTVYNIMPAAVDFEATVNLDVLDQSVHALSFTASQPISVLSVQVDGQSANFRVTTDHNGQSRFLFETSTPLSGPDHALTIAGTATRPAHGPWILPRVQLSDSQIQEGSAQIVSPAWMRLSARPVSGCVQTSAAGAGSVKIFDRYDFQLFSPSAAVEIAPSQALPPLVEVSGTQVNIETSQVTGVYIAELTSTAANRFAVAAQISRHWVVDAVETQPLEMLADRALTSGKDGVQQLELKLARPLSSTRPLRVTIRAHYRRPALNEALDASFFQMTHFPKVGSGRQLVSVQVHDPSAQLVLSDDASLNEISAAQLSARERSLFEEPPDGLIFENGDSLASIRALLVPATPQYHADVLVRADVNRHSVAQRVTIHCQPEASAVASVLVRLAPAPSGEATWRLAGEVPRELPAALELRPVADQRSEQFFRVLLPRPQTTAFEIVGEWSHPLPSESALTLVTLPEASRQQGLLEVHSPTSRVAIHATDLQPLPFAPPGSVAASENTPENPLRGRYRYDSGGQGQAMVQLAASDTNSLGTWIETLHLRSYFSLDGAGEHEARLIVHGGGESALALPLPPRATSFRLVHANGTEENLDPAGGEHSLRVPLNSAQERSELRLRYCSGPTITEAWPFASLTAPVLQPQAVVLAQSWEVVLPPQFIGITKAGHNQQLSFSSLPAAASPSKSPQSPIALLAGAALLEKLINHNFASISAEPSFVGWSVIQSDLPPGPEVSLFVYRADSISAGSWALALLGISLVGWFRCHLKWIPALAAFWATLAVAANPPWSSLATGLAAGLAAGSIFLLFWSRRVSSTTWLTRLRPVPPSLGMTVSTTAAVLLAIGLSHVIAAPPQEPSALQRRPKVVFPIDANQQPAGDYVYVEESLYQRLHQSAERGTLGLPAWLLEGAHYELPAAPKIHGDTAAVDELRAVFDFFTFHEATPVRLPLRREQVLLLEGRARLDGQPATLTWKHDGLELSLTVPDAGKHRLELALGATARQFEDGMHVALALPAAAHSSVTLPPGAELRDPAGIRLATAQPQPIPLPHHSELHVVWPAGNLGSAGKAVLEAEQYSLWRVHSGSVVLESQFRLKPIGGAVREVVIEVDPRLRPLPSQAAGTSPRTTIERGVTTLVRIELPEPISAETNVRLSWLWPDVSGLGQFEFPTVHLRADRLTRDWTAISLESGLALARPPTPAVTPTTPEFAAAFGETENGRITLAWDSSAGQSLVVATQPAISLPLAEESIAWSVFSSATTATLTTRLTDVAKTRFEHRFHIPPQLEVKQVSLTQRGKAVAIRWEQHDADLTVSLLESPELEQTLTLQAEFPRETGSTQFHIPQIILRDLKRRETTVSIYRQPDVQISLQATADWQQQPQPKEQSAKDHQQLNQGRLVAAFRGDVATAPPILVSLQPNQPRLAGKMLTRVAQADGDWSAEVELQLQITGGVLDELRLSVPAQWADRLNISPDMDQNLEGTLGDARRRLVLRPHTAASGAWQARLRGPLLSGPDGLRAPDISVEGHPEIQRLVMLDSNSGMGQLDWVTTGLAALDETAQQAVPAAWRGLSGNLFQVVAPRFEATAHTKYDAQRLTQIHLADIHAVLHGDRRLAVTVHLTVLPAKNSNPASSNLEFTLPPGCRLLQTLADGIAVPHSPLGLRSWQLASPSDLLPYRLTIVYDLPLPTGEPSAVALSLAAPRLRGTTVAHTLWSLDINDAKASPHSPLRLAAVMCDGKKLTASGRADADLIRLQSLAKTIEDLAATQGDNLPPSVMAETFTRWERLFSATHRRLQSPDDQPPSQQRTDDIRVCVDTVAKIRQRWQQAGMLPVQNRPADPRSPISDEVSGLATPFSVNAEHPEIEIVLSRGVATAPHPRVFTIAILTALTVIFAVTPNIAAARTPLLAHAHFALGAAGFAWWLLAPFGWFGLLLMLIAVWLAIRSPWPSAAALK